jgi:hypothetical protein
MVGFPVTASAVVLSVAKTIIGGSESATPVKASITLLGRLLRTSHSTLLQVRSSVQKNGFCERGSDGGQEWVKRG